MNKSLLEKSHKDKKDTIVSVRLPHSLVNELKDIQEVNHFMDLSDEIRFVVRRYCLKFLNSDSTSDKSHSLDILAEQRRKEKLIEELSKIIDSLKNKDSNSKNKNE